MTAVAGTAEYNREYQRRRALGLSTKGLAAELRSGDVVPPMSGRKLKEAQQLYARGFATSRVMHCAGLSYAQCQQARTGMGS